MNEAKRYLLRLHTLDVRINQLIEERNDLLLIATGNSSPRLDPNRVQTSGGGDVMARQVERYVDVEKKITRMIDKYVDLKHKMILEIQELPDDRHVQLLNLRYVKMLRFEEIAVTMGYSYDWVRHVHGDALESFGRMYGLNTRRHTKTH